MKLKDKKVLVLGMGISGTGMVDLLERQGAKVVVGEIKNAAQMQVKAKELEGRGIKVHLGPHPLHLLDHQDLIIPSPGISLDIPLLQRAKDKGISIIGELELASRFIKDTSLVAITGTNGKTTTTFLTGQILKRARGDVEVAGNIGTSLSGVVQKKSSIIVVEVSSFQLETIEKFHPFISCILNISPDHLDRHHSFTQYAHLKGRIFLNQNKEDFTILNKDDSLVHTLAEKTRARRVFVSQKNEPDLGVFLKKGRIIARFGREEEIASLSRIRFPGSYNLENILSAVAISSLYRVSPEVMRDVLEKFKGLPHRAEAVGRVRSVQFINDSKATNEGAVKRCLGGVRGPVILIMGGRDKGANFSILRSLIRDKVKQIVLVGEAKEKIKEELSGICPMVESDELPSAVRYAFNSAEPGDSVLLSPGCTSFDEFKSFEERGEVFKREVEKLREEYEKQN
ncbi:UDP-N-acetylmuramoylalanine--D-glutamate ligase [subsurface metagenome]